jgi:glycosyltransferase involved in cell wall biosynthesis
VVLDVPPNIEWMDFSYDVRPVYAKSRIILIPSVYESFCMVAFEAMMNGIPVIYTKPGASTFPQGSTLGVDEWISPAGIPCDPKNADEWISAIESLDDSEV